MCFLGSVDVRIYVHGVYSVGGQTEDLSKAHFGSILYALVSWFSVCEIFFCRCLLFGLLHELLV